jgi:CheY-like chemotaxis protein
MKINILFHILLVEDNELIQQSIIRRLKKEGHSVEVADNGKKAVGLLEKQRFDLVLMDIQMPYMDGVEATRIIRDPNSKVLDHEIPIIACTSFECRGGCFEAGMDAYVSKPFQIEELYHALNDLAGRELSKERNMYREKKP